MSDPYLGEIRMFAGNFAPVDWALCNGQTLNISENDALYALLGTQFGGDGQTTFGLPDLRGRVAMHPMAGDDPGEMGGSETVTITATQYPQHTHAASAFNASGSSPSPKGNYWAGATPRAYAISTAGAVPMSPAAISAVAGGSMPHENMMPFLAVTFIISTAGIWPPRNP